MNALVPLLVGVPLLGATLLALAGLWLPRRACDAVAVGVAAATTVLCVIVLVRTGRGLDVHWFGGWHPRGHVAIGIDFAVDAFGAGLAAFTGLLMTLAMVYVLGPQEDEDDHPHFQVLMLVFLAAMVGFVVSGDLFNLFVFFELMSVAGFALVGYKSEQRASLEGALNFAVTNTVGSFVFLVGLALVYGRTGALNLAQIGEALARQPADTLVLVAFALLLVGFFVKAAIVPFHFWLADAYAIAPASVCLLLAGAMSEMGLFGVGRIWFTAFHGALVHQEAAVRAVLVTLGLVTALWGAVMALAQDHLKRMLAFVTISAVGEFLVALAFLSADGAAAAGLYVVADGLGKAGLFACVGIVEHRTGHVRQSRLHGRVGHLRVTGGLFAVLGLVLTAIPPSGAFLAKSMLDETALKAGYWFVPALLALGLALNAGAVLRAWGRIFRGWGAPAQGPDEPADERAAGAPRTPLTMLIPALVLGVGAVGLGAWFGLADLVLGGAERFVDQGAYAKAILESHVAAVPAGSTPTPEGFDYAYSGASLLGALVVAAIGLWAERLGAPARLAVRGGRGVAAPLQRLHSGRVGDYVTWLVVGAGGLAAVFAAAR